MSYLTINTPFSGRYSFEVGNIRTLVDLGGIAILYAHLIQCCELRVRKELEAVQNVLQNQYVQYKQSRESIELINYKYHDLKHQIAFLRSENDPAKREEFLNRMEDEIRQYEAQNKTGNQVLDTVLTTKSLYCAKHGITFTCVADGTLLDFMDVMDICSIFGNALDNAIECELKIPDKEKRLIHVTVSKQKNFLILRFENYYEEALQYKEGKLVTTKKDKEYHGYGLKSIRYTVNKYDDKGRMTESQHQNMLFVNSPNQILSQKELYEYDKYGYLTRIVYQRIFGNSQKTSGCLTCLYDEYGNRIDGDSYYEYDNTGQWICRTSYDNPQQVERIQYIYK